MPARPEAEILADIAAVRRRMASGVSMVSAGDMTTKFDTANDPAILTRLEAELAGAVNGGVPVTRMTFARICMRRY